MKLKNLLTEDVLKILSEDSLSAIEKAFASKLDVAVRTALSEQDEQYAAKLKTLLEAIDRDCTSKLKRVVNAIDQSTTKKLKNVVNRYEKTLNEDAKKFKVQMINGISQFIDEYIGQAIPIDSINEAVQNKTATNVLANLRQVLAVDSALMKESVKDALRDGKTTIDTLQDRLSKLERSNKVLKESLQKTQVALLLEQKTTGMPASRKKHIMKTLGDKSVEFINENFDYTKTLIIKNERRHEDDLRTEAFTRRTIKSDVIVEKTQPTIKKPQNTAVNEYLSELKRLK